MKKILFLCGWYYPDSTGGTENYVYWLAKELIKKGFEVKIAAPASDEKEVNYIHQGISIYRYPVPLNPTVQEVKGHVPQRYGDIFLGWLKQNRPDIVHMHSFTRGCGWEQAKIIKQERIPLVFTAHMPDFICKRGTMMIWGKFPCEGKINVKSCVACYLHKRGMPVFLGRLAAKIPYFISAAFEKNNTRAGTLLGMKKLLLKRQEDIGNFLKLADYVIAVSKWLYDAILANGGNYTKLILIRHGLPQKRLISKKNKAWEAGSRVLTIGYLGRFNHSKGLHILIKAVKRLPSEVKVKLKLYGKSSNSEEDLYFSFIKRIGEETRRIVFCGELKPEEKKSFFKDIDILAVPSLWFEAGPLVVLEAFSCGVPVMGSDVGGIAELVTNRKNGILIRAGDVKKWADQIKKICIQPNLVREMANNVPQVKTMEEVARKNVCVYEKIFSEK